MDDAVQMTPISFLFMVYFLVRCKSSRKSISVMVLICSTCMPLSPFLNSTMWLSMVTIMLLLRVFS